MGNDLRFISLGLLFSALIDSVVIWKKSYINASFQASSASKEIDVLDLTNKSLPYLIGRGARHLLELSCHIVERKGYSLTGAEFLLSIKYCHNRYTGSGIPDNSCTSTPHQHIDSFPYIVTRIFTVGAFQLQFPLKSKKQNIRDLFLDFLQKSEMFTGMKPSVTLIVPFIHSSPGVPHTFLTFIEKDNDTYHICVVDSLGPEGAQKLNTYSQKDAREGLEDALRAQFGKEIKIELHYGPDQNNLMLCGIHVQMNVEAAVHWLTQKNKKIFQCIDQNIEIFPKRTREELLNYFEKDREIAEKWYAKYSHITFSKSCFFKDIFLN